jgi:CRP-like cAMP-binding protein
MDHSLCALTPVMLAFIPHEAIRDLTTGYPGIAAMSTCVMGSL